MTMSLDIIPLSSALGAQISGVDLSRDLNTEQRDAIEQALLKHQVLFFREQPITPQQQTRFAAQFGDLHVHPIYPNVPEQPEIMVLDTALTDVRDNAIWHTDVTFLPTPAMGAVLSANSYRPMVAIPCGPVGLRHSKRCPGRCKSCSTG
jgi:taurine dioxygenase